MAMEAAAAAARVGIFDGTAPRRAGFCSVRRTSSPNPVTRSMPVSERSCAIKGNINRKGARIYHLPGQAHYDRTVIRTTQGERWFCTEAEAQAAGWRRARR